jgi:glutathione peroxidase
LFVNVASRCGFTSQYDDLERLYQKYKGKGLVIIAVPSNDFGEQEPGTNAEIASFCKLNYGVTFPLTTKVSVKGEQQHLLYRYLTASNPKIAGSIKWNFTKILVGKDGRVLNRFSSVTKPMSKKVINAVEAAL